MPPSALFLSLAWVLSFDEVPQAEMFQARPEAMTELRPDGAVESQRARAGAARRVDDDVAQRLAIAAQVIRDQAPIQQGAATITGARAEGGRLVTTMTIAAALDEPMMNEVRQEFQMRTCENASLRQLINAGAGIAYEVTDSDGQVLIASIDHCAAE